MYQLVVPGRHGRGVNDLADLPAVEKRSVFAGRPPIQAVVAVVAGIIRTRFPEKTKAMDTGRQKRPAPI